MTYNDLVPILKAVTTYRTQSPKLPELAAWVRETLATLPLHKTLTTRELMALGGLPDDAPVIDTRRFNAALHWLRQSGTVSDCFRHDKTRRFMGNALVLWHRPVPTIEEAIF